MCPGVLLLAQVSCLSQSLILSLFQSLSNLCLSLFRSLGTTWQPGIRALEVTWLSLVAPRGFLGILQLPPMTMTLGASSCKRVQLT